MNHLYQLVLRLRGGQVAKNLLEQEGDLSGDRDRQHLVYSFGEIILLAGGDGEGAYSISLLFLGCEKCGRTWHLKGIPQFKDTCDGTGLLPSKKARRAKDREDMRLFLAKREQDTRMLFAKRSQDPLLQLVQQAAQGSPLVRLLGENVQLLGASHVLAVLDRSERERPDAESLVAVCGDDLALVRAIAWIAACDGRIADTVNRKPPRQRRHNPREG